MRRFIVAGMSLLVAAGALVLGTSLAGTASAATCTGTVQITSMTFNPPTVAAGQSSTVTVVAQNCTSQPIQAGVTFYARFLDAPGGFPSGCVVYDPFVRPVTIPANGQVSTGVSYSTYAGCTAIALRASVTIAVGGTTLASQDATLNIIGPSASPSVTASPSVPSASCAVRYSRSSEWSGGVVVQVTVSNTGTAPVSGWTLGFAFPGDQKITNAWNATVVQAGAAVTATNASYNAKIAVGSSVSFGFQASWRSSDANPTTFLLNQAVCVTL